MEKESNDACCEDQALRATIARSARTKGKAFPDRHQRLAQEPTQGYGCWTTHSPGEVSMRVLAMALMTITGAAAILPAQAQTYDPRYPVCLRVYQGYTDYYFECGYTSLAQCNMSASGRFAQCIVNPYYA